MVYEEKAGERMNMLVVLAIILLILMYQVGGKNGVRSFISLFLNFIVVLVVVFFMLDTNTNILILTLVAVVLISSINLFYINGMNQKTLTAFAATLLTISILLTLIYVVSQQMAIHGFSEEETEELVPYSLYIGVDFLQVSAAVIVLTTIGAIVDVAISITSSMHEFFEQNHKMTKQQLYQSGVAIGRDILGTDTNTLFFAFFGGYLGLLIWFKDLSYSFGEIVNAKVFGAEMVTIFCSGIGIALIIPIAAALSSVTLQVKHKKSKPSL